MIKGWAETYKNYRFWYAIVFRHSRVTKLMLDVFYLGLNGKLT